MFDILQIIQKLQEYILVMKESGNTEVYTINPPLPSGIHCYKFGEYIFIP